MNWGEFLKLFNDCELVNNKIVIKSRLHEVIEYIVQNYSYDMLQEIIGIDVGDNLTELIYHLYSTKDEENIFISITVGESVESVTDIFKSAIADENEIYDLFGVNFIGHENLKRLYMPEGWLGYPLRKDYVENDERLRWNHDNA